jgi:hypothetical protein
MKKKMILFNVTNLYLVLPYFPSILLAGQSTALAEEIEAKKKEFKKNWEELPEHEAERKKVDEENSRLGDIDSPDEAESLQELIDWDTVIKHTKETIVYLANWFND